MARLMQLYFDPAVDHPIYPYLSIEHLAELINPNLNKDPRSLISLCIIALNAPDSARTLYDLMQNSRVEPNLDGRVLFEKYTSPDERWIISKGQKMSIQDYLIESIDVFEDYLNKSLHNELGLQHINLLLENMRIATREHKNPIIEILYNDTSPLDRIKEMISWFGIPRIRSISGNTNLPLGPDKENPAIEYLELEAQQIVFERLLGISKDGICGMYPICSQTEAMTNELCFESQWERKSPCPFTQISNLWGLPAKIL
ncbi:hypothetical protein [Aureitalea marina]|uniref:Uncharacterized protein n=1 Tax=Aureitalea marina TaxID=930804 RepID=A0A2S7KNF3_9FLAO|nr:hypothetical protein [Aureitalea marina]PQB04120.1 hypothetical protein BST85_03790 [Aureitalea marina]